MLKKITSDKPVYHADNTDVISSEVLKSHYQDLLKVIGKQTSYRKFDSYAKVTGFSFSLLVRGKIDSEYMVLLSEEKIVSGIKFKKTDDSSDINDYSVDELLAMARESKNSWTGMLLGSIRNHSCKTQVTCPSCEGDTKCNKCDGNGTVACGSCNGCGECSNCKGKGKVECQKCEGSGSINCFYCDGDGYVDCYNCDGDGWVDCWDCDGTGTYRKPNGKEVVCRKCQGTGRFECRACDGSGTSTCEKCDGSGTLKCRRCKGTGIVKCSGCKGSGTCSKCEGNGYVECDLCDGNGVCSECNGRGEVKCTRCEGTGSYQSYINYQLKRVNKVISKVFDNNDLVDKFDENMIGTRSIWNGIMQWDKKKGLQQEINADELGSVLAKSLHLGSIKEWIRSECVIPNGNTKMQRKELRVRVYGIPLTEVCYVVGKNNYRFYIVGNNNVLVIDDEQMPNKLVSFFRSIF